MGHLVDVHCGYSADLRGPVDVRLHRWTRHWRSELLDCVWNGIGLPITRTMGQSTWDVIGNAHHLILAPFIPVNCTLLLRAKKLYIKIPRRQCIPAATPL